jgi:hypothetical protein
VRSSVAFWNVGRKLTRRATLRHLLSTAACADDPSKYPMFYDLQMASEKTRVPLSALQEYLDGTSDEFGDGLMEPQPAAATPDNSYSAADPAGFVFHESRVGSTLVANSCVARFRERVACASAPAPAPHPVLSAVPPAVVCSALQGSGRRCVRGEPRPSGAVRVL